MPSDVLFHERLMHTGQTEILKKEMKKIYGKKYEFIDHQCVGCISGKGHDCVNQFKCYDRPVKRAGQEFHYDLFTYDSEDREGNRYVMILIDIYSGAIFPIFMKRKNEIEGELKAFCKKVAREHGKRPKAVLPGRHHSDFEVKGVSRIRSDGAGENSSNKLRKWMKTKGIQNEWTVADNPKHNSVAERAGRTVMEGAEASRHGANLPSAYWSDMVRAFAYVHNRLPKKDKIGKLLTPWENYYGVKVDFKRLISPLRRVGCQCYAVVPHYKRKKSKRRTQKKGTRCVFLGYADHQKGWVVQELATGIVRTSCHVFFDEHILVFENADHEEWFGEGKDAGKAHRSHKLGVGLIGGGSLETDSESSDAEESSSENDTSGSENELLHDNLSSSSSSNENDSDSESEENDDERENYSDDESKSSDLTKKKATDAAKAGAIAAAKAAAGAKVVGYRKVRVSGKTEKSLQFLMEYGDGLVFEHVNDLDIDASIKAKALDQWKNHELPHFYNKEKYQSEKETLHSDDDDNEPNQNNSEDVDDFDSVDSMFMRSKEKTRTVKEVVQANLAMDGSTLRDEISKVGNEKPEKALDLLNPEQIKGELKSLIEKLQIIRDRSLKIPKDRREMLKGNAQAVKHYMWAERKELNSFDELGVWELVPRPKNTNVMKIRWVYDHKFDDKGQLLKMKARLVAKGFTQIFGQDYTETFSPTAKLKSFKMLLALAASDESMELDTWDVSTAFLYAPADADMYVEQPDGYRNTDHPEWVYKLKKTVYGTKQAGRNWYQHLSKLLLDMKFANGDQMFVKSKADNCLFICKNGKQKIYILVHVDDMAVFYNDKKLKNLVFGKLEEKVALKDEGPIGMFLGIRCVKNIDGGYSLSQQHYIETLAERFQLNDAQCEGVSLPYKSSVKITSEMLEEETQDKKEAAKLPYREIIGAMNYLLITRPEIAFNQSQLAKFMANWGKLHFKAAIHQLKYLMKTKTRSLEIKPMKGTPEIVIWVDSDHFGDSDHRTPNPGASHGGFAAMVRGVNDPQECAGNLVSHRSKKHNAVTLSSTEAEIREAVNGGKEGEWLRYLLFELGYQQLKPTVLKEDNNGCISFSKNATHHDATKHVVLRYYWLKEQVAAGILTLEKVHTHSNIADIFTKPIPKPLFDKHQNTLLNTRQSVNVKLTWHLKSF